MITSDINVMCYGKTPCSESLEPGTPVLPNMVLPNIIRKKTDSKSLVGFSQYPKPMTSNGGQSSIY